MNKVFFSLLITLVSVQALKAQSLNAWLDAAELAYQEKDYYPAFKYYEIALEYDSLRSDIWYNYAEAARQFYATPYAERGYKMVLNNSIGRDSFPLTTYWLANVQQTMGKYEEAKDNYLFFLNSQPEADANIRAKAEKAIEDCEWSIEMEGQEQNLSIQPLDSMINSPYSDYGAYVLDNKLYYSSFKFVDKKDKHNPPRIFNKLLVSVDDGPGEPVPTQINEKGKHVAHTTFNADRTTMYYTVCEYVGLTEIRCNLFARTRLNDYNWGPAMALPINVDGYTSTHPSIGYDEASGTELLFFSSDRPEGKGGMDIWCSTVDVDGVVDEPVNMSDLNTDADDITPFFHRRSRTLFFSSNGYPVFGGYDIFKAKLKEGNWTEAVNMGEPVNTSFNDMYYSINEEGTQAYLSSNRPGAMYLEKEKEACCNDLFKYDVDIIVDLLALTFDNSSQLELDKATVKLYEVTEYGEELVATLTNEYGNDFNFPLELNKKYKITAERDDYYPVSEMLDLTDPDLDGSQTIEKKLFLDPEKIHLKALTIEEEDRDPIIGATVNLMELNDGILKPIAEKTNKEGNDFIFPLALDQVYVITAEKIGFEPRRDTIVFTRNDVLVLGDSVTIELPMLRINFDDFLPLALYFDNDMPDRRSARSYTESQYTDLYGQYYSKKDEFIEQFTEGLPENEKFLTGARFEDFFEREVRGGQRDLNGFTEKLHDFLAKGNSIELTLKGYASPRASQQYNKLLSKRRVESLKNHFRTYQNGQLIPFLNDGSLKITDVAFGEETAADGIPDAIDDVKNSIYSVLASVERRVEIVEAKTERRTQQ